jgi:Family of unknown function (DUF5990)
VRITIRGRRLPGREFISDGGLLRNVHVAVQEGKEPRGLVPGDAPSATWDVEVRQVTDAAGQIDARGRAVHGKRGDRFLYLTWGDVRDDGSFAMFRRAKLMIPDIEPDLWAAGGDLVAELELTDARGGPVCARVRPPAIRWSRGRPHPGDQPGLAP